jgi:hypothetical protein
LFWSACGARAVDTPLSISSSRFFNVLLPEFAQYVPLFCGSVSLSLRRSAALRVEIHKAKVAENAKEILHILLLKQV